MASTRRDGGQSPPYGQRYYAANMFDPDGYSIEVVYKRRQQAPA